MGTEGTEGTTYSYSCESLVYACNWSVRQDKPLRLAVASFREETQNHVQLIQVDEERGVLAPLPNMTFRHDYPPTKLMFLPDRDPAKPDLLATTGEYLRLWRVHSDGVQLERLLTHGKSSKFTAPLTSFDWSEVDTRRLGVSSIDTTCTIWDLERGVVDTQLIAHDKEVYDICWGGPTVFGTVSADGSVRIFDLRDKEHSTIVYETADAVPLLRLAWNKQDPRYLATLCLDSNRTIILDIRYPSVPCTELWRHSQPVNCVAWAPHTSSYICTAGDDAQVLIWELQGLGQQGGKDGAGAAAAAAAGGEAPGGASAGASGGTAAADGAAGSNGHHAGAGAGARSGAGAPGGGRADALSGGGLDPVLAYGAAAEINQLQWSSTQHEWLAICFNNVTQILRI